MSTTIIDARLYGLFFVISLDFNFAAVNIDEAVGKKIWKPSKNEVCGSLRITSIRIPSSEKNKN